MLRVTLNREVFYYCASIFVIVSVVKDEVTLNCTSVMRRVLEKRRAVLKADGVNHT